VRIDENQIDSMFAFHYFGSAFGRAQILAATKRVTISGIDSQQLKDILVCTPPINEQKEILSYVQRSECGYVSARDKIAAVVNRLVEYRSALITNAVTGKIDLRDWQAPEERL